MRSKFTARRATGGAVALLAALCVLTLQTFAQSDFSGSTAGGTNIVNQASASYSDGTNTWNTTSNTVTTTVSYVAGLKITPDGGTLTANPGATATYTFTVTNIGNFTDEVRFLASGASITKTDASSIGTISQAFIDVNTNGTYDAGTDVDILGNGADVTRSATQGGSFTVVVKVAISAAASAGATVQIKLGDTATNSPTFDNVAANNSANEVRTSRPSGFTGTVVNGDATNHNMEARGDITLTVNTVGAVLNGPNGAPDATGGSPADNNHDYTNKSTNPSATNTQVTFTNTLKNTGNSADTFTLTVPTYPANATVIINVGGSDITVVSNGTPTGNTVTTASVATNGTFNYTVKVTLPAGATTLTGYDTVIRATSVNTPASTNDTYDNVWTGFLRLTKTATVANGTGIGGATDPVPGAVITYTITYTNVTPAATGTGSIDLTATSIQITEDGTAAPNNWATYTTMVTSPAPSDSNGGTIIDIDTSGAVSATTSKLKDTIASLGPNASGTFTFKRTIR
ncbi:MAG TPA: hypothetical protein VNQ79_23260 [Blastocatellia bacterium]|nr:hypothetical protein [Blastocatellia bacterium]